MARQCTQQKRPGNSTWFKEKIQLVQAQESGQALDEEQLAFLADPGVTEGQDTQTTMPHNDAFQTDDLDAFDSECDEAPGAKAVLMANLSSYDSDVTSGTESVVVQNNTSTEQKNVVIMSVFDEIFTQVAKCNAESIKNKNVNEFLTAELERYKKRVKMFEERQKGDLNSREKLIDSQMNDMILNRNAKFATFQKEINTLKSTLSKHIKENESVMTTIDILKKQTKEKEDKYIEEAIDLEKQKKELENIVYKVELLLENDRLLELIISQDLVHTAVNTLAAITDYESMRKSYCEEYNRNLTLETELSIMNELSKTCSRLQNHCISIELKHQQNKESFQNNRSCNNLDAPALNELFVINDLKAQLQTKESSISKLRAHITTLKGKSVSDNNLPMNSAFVIVLEMFRLDLEPLSSKLKNNREAHEDYLHKTKEHTDTLCWIVEQARKLNPTDPCLDFACKFTIRVQELLAYVSETCPSSQLISKKLVAVTPMNKTRKVSASGLKPRSNTMENRISQAVSSNQKNKVEDLPRSVKSCLNKKNLISECIASTKQNVLKANSKSLCKTCNKCLFNACDDECVVDYLMNVNKRAKSRTDNKNQPGNLQRTDTGSRDTNLLSHLNFSTINELAKQGLVRGLPKLKYEKYHLCSACSLGKSKKHTYKPKSEDSKQEKLYMLHMDLCGPMGIESINGKKYILVIIDDYSRFTWVKYLRSKDETPKFVIKFLKMIQVRLNDTVRNICTDNGTKCVNQTLKSYYEDVGISHQTSVARTS
ncbi:retrovirus-related pol polyprotein from transposon TNT 1-94 [Tanacetum coccineum]